MFWVAVKQCIIVLFVDKKELPTKPLVLAENTLHFGEAYSFSIPDYPGHQCPRALPMQDRTSWLASILSSKVLQLYKGK